MLKRTKIVALLASSAPQEQVLLKGWVRTRRDAKDFSFIEVNDGSCLKNMQVIANNTLKNYEDIKKTHNALVSLQMANSEIGTIQNMKEIFKINFHIYKNTAVSMRTRGVFASLSKGGGYMNCLF